jgi:hypothetical protein
VRFCGLATFRHNWPHCKVSERVHQTHVNRQIPTAYGFRKKSERLVIVGDFVKMWKGAIEPQFIDITVEPRLTDPWPCMNLTYRVPAWAEGCKTVVRSSFQLESSKSIVASLQLLNCIAVCIEKHCWHIKYNWERSWSTRDCWPMLFRGRQR